MSFAKKVLFGGIPAIAIGGAGVWWWMNGFGGNSRRGVNLSLSQRKFKKSQGSKQQLSLGPSEEQGDDLDTEENVLIYDPKVQIGEAGLNCEDASREIDCLILNGGLNVEIDGVKRENYEFSGDNNGKFRFRISEDKRYSNKFRFIVTGKPIKLQSKTDSTQTITLDKYENYGLERDEDTDKVYLTRKLTADQGRIRSLGLPDRCVLPREVSTKASKDPTCKLTTNQIRSVNFDGKKNGGATGGSEVELYIQKVNDTTTYRGGYKFTFRPTKWEVDINGEDKIKGGVFKDFMLKDPNADDLSLEMVWKDVNQLLGKVGLNCDVKGKCSIKEGSLKIKKGNISIENGRKKKIGGEEGEIYLEKNRSGYYEGLMFVVWGKEGMTMESSNSTGSTIKTEELSLYHIVKEEKDGASSYYLTKKEDGVDEVIEFYSGADQCSPLAGKLKECTGNKNHLRNYRFFDGKSEKKVTVDGNRIPIKITVTPNQSKRVYPLGYKFTINPKEDIKIGNITLGANVDNNFKIKIDRTNRRLYLEEYK